MWLIYFKRDLINQGLNIFPCVKINFLTVGFKLRYSYYSRMIANNVCSPKNKLHDHIGISTKIDNIAVFQVFSW
jgi:hypothetical protein